MKLLFPILVIITLCAVLAGCAGTPPYSFEQGVPDQIPNWDGEALVRCCGHLTHCEPHQTPRC